MPVAIVFENLEFGSTVDEVMEEFSVTREQINAILHFAAQRLAAPLPAQAQSVDACRCSFSLTAAHPAAVAPWLKQCTRLGQG